ncbi:MAG: hypothetical protein AB1420_15870 [Bacillota bacterium]
MTETIEPSKRKVKCTKCDWKGLYGQTLTLSLSKELPDIQACPICKGYVIADFEGKTWSEAGEDVYVEFRPHEHEIRIWLPKAFIFTAEEEELIKEQTETLIDWIIRSRGFEKK